MRTFRITSFILILFTLWIVRQYLYTEVDQTLHGLPKLLLGIALKIAIWIGLMLFYLKFIYKTDNKQAFKLKLSKNGLIWALIFGIILLTSNLLLNLIVSDNAFKIDLTISTFISAVIFAPLTEEFVFRGFILEKLKEILSFKYANLITAILFMGIHFPGWIIWGGGINILNATSILVVGFIWGYMYKKSNSLWTPIAAHAINNFVSLIV